MPSISSMTAAPSQAHRLAAVMGRERDPEQMAPTRPSRTPERLEQAVGAAMGVSVSISQAQDPEGAMSSSDDFAGLLYGALRDVGPGGEQRGGNGRGNAYGLERGAGWNGRGWGSLAMRVELLAQRYAGIAAATQPAPAPTTATANEMPQPVSPVPAPAAAAVEAQAGADAAALPQDAAAAPVEGLAVAEAAAEVAPPPPALDPLLAAYSAIVSIGGGSSAGDAAGLRDFLFEIAEGLRPGGSSTSGFLDLRA